LYLFYEGIDLETLMKTIGLAILELTTSRSVPVDLIGEAVADHQAAT
jgi:hypothetical protein